MCKLTIFTPTFNRGHILEKAYQSIVNQNMPDIEWIIVDDGSTDNTEILVADWINKNQLFPIRYFWKENGGKHTAVNVGVQNAVGAYFLILDSDDQLAPHALTIYYNIIAKFKDDGIGGILSLTMNENETIIGTKFPKDNYISKFADLYYKQKISGDKAVLFKTSYLKEFPFPEPPGIRFVSELCVWHPFSERYPMMCINNPTIIVDYQAAGLTDSSYKRWYLEGVAFTNFYLIKNNIHPWFRFPRIRWQETVQLIINSRLVRQSFFKKLNLLEKIIYVIAFPRAYYSYLNMKRYVEKDNF